MKKIYSLIAGLMLAGAATQALAVDVSFNGVIREYLETDDINGGVASANNHPGVKLTNFTSKFIVKAVEPLNDVSPGLKLKAEIATEFFMDNPTNNSTYEAPLYRQNQIGNNKSVVGVANDWYSLEFGRKGHMIWWAEADFDALDDFQGTGMGEVHSRQGLRFNNGIFANVNLTPEIKLTYETELSEQQNVSNPYDVAVTYNNGKAEVRAIHFDRRNGLNQSEVLAGSYTFPTNTQVLVEYSHDKAMNWATMLPMTTNGYSIGAKQPFGGKWLGRAQVGYRDDGVYVYTAGVDYQATRNVAVVARVNHTEADHQIYMTIPVDFQGAVGTSRTNLSAGVEFYF